MVCCGLAFMLRGMRGVVSLLTERSDTGLCCGGQVLNRDAVRLKRLAQVLTLAGVAVCMLLLVYISVSGQPQQQVRGLNKRTPRSVPLNYTALKEVFISVRTTLKFHRLRLPVILKTWFQLAKEQTWFFTDSDDAELQQKTNGHMVNTKCPSSDDRNCCKLSAAFDTFLTSGKKWFCHVDDDNYVNIPRLVRFLADYSPQEDWYLGKRAPLKHLSSPSMQRITFWFATSGAGFCLSRALALKMMPVASDGKYVSICENMDMNDDVTMGYIVELLMRKPLTVIDKFHSHLEPMDTLQQDSFHEQITFSYKDENVLTIDGFEKRRDLTRFLSLHCFLFPRFSFCPK